MSGAICCDNRFEVIEKAKKHLLEATNIENSQEEMKVIDDILFRCWQCGFLDKFDDDKTKIYDRPYIIWHNYAYEKPKDGVEVIAYNKKWVDADFNPNGQRVGFYSDNGFNSAFWWDYQDEYISINKNKCENNIEMYQNHLDNIEPEWWTEIPLFKNAINS